MTVLAPPIPLPGTLWLHTVAGPLLAGRADVYVATLGILPRRLVTPTVLVVHDLTPRSHPGQHTLANRFCFNAYFEESLAGRRRWCASPRRPGRRSLTSQPQAARRAVVIPVGVDADVLRGAPVTWEGRRRVGVSPRGRPYLVQLGTLEPRKGIATLLAAHGHLRRAAPTPRTWCSPAAAAGADGGWSGHSPATPTRPASTCPATSRVTTPAPCCATPRWWCWRPRRRGSACRWPRRWPAGPRASHRRAGPGRGRWRRRPPLPTGRRHRARGGAAARRSNPGTAARSARRRRLGLRRSAGRGRSPPGASCFPGWLVGSPGPASLECRAMRRLGIDARKLDDYGIGSYLQGLLGELARLGPPEGIVVLVAGESRDLASRGSRNLAPGRGGRSRLLAPRTGGRAGCGGPGAASTCSTSRTTCCRGSSPAAWWSRCTTSSTCSSPSSSATPWGSPTRGCRFAPRCGGPGG